MPLSLHVSVWEEVVGERSEVGLVAGVGVGMISIAGMAAGVISGSEDGVRLCYGPRAAAGVGSGAREGAG